MSHDLGGRSPSGHPAGWLKGPGRPDGASDSCPLPAAFISASLRTAPPAGVIVVIDGEAFPLAASRN